MSFTIITDTSANLPTPYLKSEGIQAIPFSYYIDGKEFTCTDTETFNCREYYELIKGGMRVTTSQITPQKYIETFSPILEEGSDILFVSMSSGISGSYSSAETARKELQRKYPQRKIHLIDSLGASLGEGLVVLKAAEYRKNGMSVDETAEFLLNYRKNIYQVFTVDDLMHLRRGGRLSNASAIVGTILNIKPLLKGNEEGKIVTIGKVKGRKSVIEKLAEKYDTLVKNPEKQTVGIAHANSYEDAELLAKLLKRNNPPREIIIAEYEPVTGSYLGPDALALFFESTEDVRLK
ncbi:MAG: DegV family protein [Clostridia bacterium]|nr:DegV family protein [Clostridia bacterium]